MHYQFYKLKHSIYRQIAFLYSFRTKISTITSELPLSHRWEAMSSLQLCKQVFSSYLINKIVHLHAFNHVTLSFSNPLHYQICVWHDRLCGSGNSVYKGVMNFMMCREDLLPPTMVTISWSEFIPGMTSHIGYFMISLYQSMTAFDGMLSSKGFLKEFIVIIIAMKSW